MAKTISAGAVALALLLPWPHAGAVPRDYLLPVVDVSGDGTAGLALVQSDDFSQTQVLVGGGLDPDLVGVHTSGALVNGVLANNRPTTLFFAEGGAWKRVALRGVLSAEPTAEQASSETRADQACKVQLIQGDLADKFSATLVYELSDGPTCAAGPITGYAINLFDGPTVAPRPVYSGHLEDFFPVYGKSGKLTEALVRQDGQLRAYNADLSTSTTLVATAKSFSAVTSLPDGGAVIILNGGIRRVRSDGLLRPKALLRPHHGYRVGHVLVGDGVVFLDYQAKSESLAIKSRIYRLRTDPTIDPVVMLELPVHATVERLTAAKLIYSVSTGVGDGAQHNLLSIGRSAMLGSELPVRLLRVKGTASFELRGGVDSTVFVDVLHHSPEVRTALALHEAGGRTQAQYGDGSSWLALDEGGRQSLSTDRVEADRMLLARRGQNDPLSHAYVSGVDAATFVKTPITRMGKSDVVSPFPFLIGSREGRGPASLGTCGTDVCAFDIEQLRFLTLQAPEGHRLADVRHF